MAVLPENFLPRLSRVSSIYPSARAALLLLIFLPDFHIISPPFPKLQYRPLSNTEHIFFMRLVYHNISPIKRYESIVFEYLFVFLSNKKTSEPVLNRTRRFPFYKI